MAVREQIPVMINISKLLKDISREIRHAERYINHLNPPKPERESQRKRKKPVNKDFVDYSQSPKSIAQEVRLELVLRNIVGKQSFTANYFSGFF